MDPGDWMVVLDLQDTYFHIPVLQSDRCYLRFQAGQEHFRFSVLTFGLTSTHWVFTKVMVVVTAHLWRLGIPVLPYLDDWLLETGSPKTVINHLQTTADLLTSLGFSFNVPKSHLSPSQVHLSHPGSRSSELSWTPRFSEPFLHLNQSRTFGL